MVMEIDNLALKFAQAGELDIVRSLNEVSMDAKRRGVTEYLPDPALTTPEAEKTPLQREWDRQANRLANLFAKELGITKDQYIASLPKLEPQPEDFKGRFDTFAIVEVRFSPRKLCELANIGGRRLLESVGTGYWRDGKFDAPYIAWHDEGTRSMNRTVADVRQELADDERPGTIYDGIAAYIAKPGILKNKIKYMFLPGTWISDEAYNRFHGYPAVSPDNRSVVALDFSCGVGISGTCLSMAHPDSSSLICGIQK